MNKMIGNICSTLPTAVVLCAFTLTLWFAPSMAFDPRNPTPRNGGNANRTN